MKIIIAGGTGQVGTMLARDFQAKHHEVVVLSRRAERADWPIIPWDAETVGDWSNQLNDADVVINLAGKNVNCRYSEKNRREIMNSRVRSTKVIGEAIAGATNPPKVWLQASTATIYAHSFDRANDEFNGTLGGGEPGAPKSWNFSIEVAKDWEKTANEAVTPRTRKVLMRSAVILSPDRGGIFDVLLGLVRKGLGGTAGSGRQYISWLHDRDFIRAIYFLIEREELDGVINLAAPEPLPNREFMKILRAAWGTNIALPANELMLTIGAFLMRTETELVLKSRRVVPARLAESSFTFDFPTWEAAARDLCERWRNLN